MRISDGAKGTAANGGYIHILRDRQRSQAPSTRTVHIRLSKDCQHDLDAMAEQCRRAVKSDELHDLAYGLGLTVESLVRLRIGWSADHRAWTFPMVFDDGHVVGIRLRLRNGRKLSVTGGHEGLFVPDGLTFKRPLLVTEGPTDCAALLGLDFEAIGRPCCTGGVAHVVELVRSHWPLEVVVVADADEPGLRGARSLASSLLPVAQAVRVIQPPQGVNDARAWKLAGATHANVQEIIDVASIRRFSVCEVHHG
jgi:hypothetical protein